MVAHFVDVSVVVPCFRCAGSVERAVASVLCQLARPREVILVDDCSQDGTLELLHEMASREPGLIKVVAMQTNQGAGQARNAGWDLARGRFVAFLDADDSWHPQKLSVQYAYMCANPGVMLSGHTHRFGEYGPGEPLLQGPLNTRELGPWAVMLRNPFVTPSVMVLAATSHRFRSGRRYMEDHLLWMELALSGARVVKLEAPLATLYKGQVGVGGLSSHVWSMSGSDFSNYLLLYKFSGLGAFGLVACWSWVVVKFLRRAMLLLIKRFLGGGGLA